MYYAHFGLNKAPFKITPDTSVFFSGADRGSVLDALSYAVLSGEGITKVIGEVGSGKTMLCRMLEEKLPAHVDTIYISNPSISPENILNVIAFEAGLVDQSHSKLEAMQALQQWLLEKHADNRHVVTLIEEAQGMPLDTLEEIRLLSNLETAEHKLMQIVLFGQPELDEKLATVSIRQLKERIAHNFYLSPLTRIQIKDYLNFRMQSAGYTGVDIFNDKICRIIAKYSKGLIRRVNILADKILLAAYADGGAQVLPKHARRAAKDSQFIEVRTFPRQAAWTGAFGLLVGLLFASVFWRWSGVPNWQGQQHAASESSQAIAAIEPVAEVDQTAAMTRLASQLEAEIADASKQISLETLVNDESIVESEKPAVDATAIPQSAEIETAVNELENEFELTLSQDQPQNQQDSDMESEIEADIAAEINGEKASEGAFAGFSEAISEQAGAEMAEETSEKSLVTEFDTANAELLATAEDLTAGEPQEMPQNLYQGALQERMSATQQWLEQADQQAYSIQLMMLNRNSKENLNNYLNNLPKTIDLSDIFIYEAHINGQNMLGVLYQAFDTKSAARSKLRDMPKAFDQYEPYLLRSVRGLRSEIAKNSH